MFWIILVYLLSTYAAAVWLVRRFDSWLPTPEPHIRHPNLILTDDAECATVLFLAAPVFVPAYCIIGSFGVCVRIVRKAVWPLAHKAIVAFGLLLLGKRLLPEHEETSL